MQLNYDTTEGLKDKGQIEEMVMEGVHIRADPRKLSPTQPVISRNHMEQDFQLAGG
jgi:hypothetical protein